VMYLRIYTNALNDSGSQGIAVLEATRAHTAANITLVLIVIAGLVARGLQG